MTRLYIAPEGRTADQGARGIEPRFTKLCPVCRYPPGAHNMLVHAMREQKLKAKRGKA